jgi:hypothetical protein
MSKNPINARMALRHEGDFINAYYARLGTMENAVLLGSLRWTLAVDGTTFEAWKAVMTEAFRIAIKQALGIDVDMKTQRAPEHERSGRA